MDARTFADLVVEFEPAFGRLLMSNWRLPDDVQDGGERLAQLPRIVAQRSGRHRERGPSAGNAHHVSAAVERRTRGRKPGVRAIGRIPRRSARMLAKRDHVRGLAGLSKRSVRADFDLICLGSGPAGQKAAIQAAKAGFHAAVIEREPQVGGSCLLVGDHSEQGACASRRCAIGACAATRRRSRSNCRGDAPLSALLQGVGAVIAAQDRYLQAQLARNQIELLRGRGVLLGAEPRRTPTSRRNPQHPARIAHHHRHRLPAAACERDPSRP